VGVEVVGQLASREAATKKPWLAAAVFLVAQPYHLNAAYPSHISHYFFLGRHICNAIQLSAGILLHFAPASYATLPVVIGQDKDNTKTFQLCTV
jgi:hypothetical protein